jgi:hypothetical protein
MRSIGKLLLAQMAPPAIGVALSFLIIGLNFTSIRGQEIKPTSAINKAIPSLTGRSNDSLRGPKFSEYKGVRIGMSADEARQKLGKARAKDKTQDLYVFSDNESAQVFYDDKQLVYAISVDYTGKEAAPAPVDILGQDVTPKADGSIYQMQQYADAGYWVSYNRTAGNPPVVSVTMQRIAGSKQ